MIISHDRWFLDRIATHILAWEGEENPNWFWFEGNFDAYEKNKIERLGAEAARPHRGHVPQAHPHLDRAYHQRGVRPRSCPADGPVGRLSRLWAAMTR